MSLTRSEWLEMWKDIKQIEDSVDRVENCCGCSFNEDGIEAIKKIKDKIESVIGQMRTSADEL